MISISWLIIPDYAHFDVGEWLTYLLCGVAGFFIWTVHTNATLQGPHKALDGGWQLGSIGNLICSMAIATLSDHNILVATAAGTGATVIIQVFLAMLPDAMKRAFGLYGLNVKTEEKKK